MNKRIYQGKDVDMLVTCSAIVNSAIANQEYLASKRPAWIPVFFDSLATRIDNAVTAYLGVDSAAELRKATQIVTEMQTEALAALTEAKVQIQEDFKADKTLRDEVIKNLGYTTYFKKAKAKDQEALIQLLYRFKSALTPGLKTQITDKGTAPEILDRIVAFADRLYSANAHQEGQKGAKKEINDEAINEFNAIYSDVISVAKIAYKFYRGNPLKQSEFSYTKVRKRLNAPR